MVRRLKSVTKHIKFFRLVVVAEWFNAGVNLLAVANALTQLGPISKLTDPLDSQQFTGLHDKNGKEIYEGDILCWQKYEGKKNQIRWVVEWNNDRAGWTDWSPRNEAEVIGNIYENPELLNQ